MLNYHFSTIIISHMPTGKTDFIFNVNVVNVNMSVKKLHLNETLGLIFFWHFR